MRRILGALNNLDSGAMLAGAMTISLSDDQVRHLRLRAQRLDRWRLSPDGGVARVVRDLVGLQAQDLPAASLAVRVRSAGLLAADVERARVDERSVVRTWCMRGTLHLVAADDVGWLLSLLGPVFAKPNRRHAELGLDQDTRARGIRAIRDILSKHASMTRAEICDQLAARAVSITGQAAYHLIHLAALEGIICLGPNRDGTPTYVLLDSWINPGKALPGEEALIELARRFLAAYGPAGPEDLAAWSGLPKGDIRHAWPVVTSDAVEVNVRGHPAWIPATRADWLNEPPAMNPNVRLLAAFDTYLLGYRDREIAVAPEHAKRVNAGGGMIRPTVVVDGRVRGTWTSRRRGGSLEVVVEPFDDLPDDARAGLAEEVSDLSRFLETRVTSRITATQ
jgi:hypothetical protein